MIFFPQRLVEAIRHPDKIVRKTALNRWKRQEIQEGLHQIRELNSPFLESEFYPCP